MAMTGRNPWMVLCVAEDASDTEVQRAFRRRVKQTHPDRGGDAGEFATVVRAFADVRHRLPRERPRRRRRSTPYDGWLQPCRPTRTWTEEVAPLSVVPTDFSTVLRREMAKAGARPTGR
jgi:hypothetical protein